MLESLRDIPLGRRKIRDDETVSNDHFGIPKLSALMPSSSILVLELISPPLAHHSSGAGKTSLLYLIIAQAILPGSIFSSIATGGQSAAVILFDPLHHFSVLRLASVILNLLKSRLSAARVTIDESIRAELQEVLERSLLHLHIFRPQSWTSLIVTLRSLSKYLFDHSRHESMHRRIHSIILEDIDAFVGAIRNPPSGSSRGSNPNPLSTASTQLTTQLQRLSILFSCCTILTSHSVSASVFRPALPISWPLGTSVTRLALRRLEVIKFAPAISLEEAEVERQQRWQVVSKGRFECWKVGARVRGEEGFMFKVGLGVEIEKTES